MHFEMPSRSVQREGGGGGVCVTALDSLASGRLQESNQQLKGLRIIQDKDLKTSMKKKM